MKNFAIIILFIGCSIACDFSTESSVTSLVIPPVNQYDSLLAKEVGADDYGMRSYVFAFLKEGPNRDQDSIEVARLQRAHLDNITRMAEEGKLVMAGPFIDSWEVKGIYIFAVETVEEAEMLTNSDPAIQAGRLVMELHPWYGSAALIKMGEMHNSIAKSGI